MIVFLTLCYVGLLALLVKLGVIKPTLFWKLSPLLWMLLLFVVLFIPMQWGAPSGKVNVYRPVIEIIPNVNGEVVEVPAKPLVPMKKGDVLFRIDPVPFQNEIDRLAAELADAKQKVLQLEAAAEAASATVKSTQEEVEVRKSEQQLALDQMHAAKAIVAEAEANQQAAQTEVVDRKQQLEFAERRLERTKSLVEKNAASPDELDAAQTQFVGMQAQLNNAEAQLLAADATVVRRQADLAAAVTVIATAKLKLQQVVSADLPRVQAQEREARLAADAKIGDVPTSVARIQAQLENARYNLNQTTVRAPADGYVVGLTLRPGQRVANLPLRSWIAFVETEKFRVAAGIPQYTMRHVAPGQTAEVVLALYPGKTFAATVESIAPISADAQLQPSGLLPSAPSVEQASMPYGVILQLTDEVDPSMFHGGAAGTAAIYTDRAKMTQIIRRIMIRMESWMNFIIAG